MEKLNDLRFIIGLFFAIVGVVLVLLPLNGTDGKAFSINLNLFSGAAMLVLATLLFWVRGKKN
jgi:drug/metabolite transporter (DMT)-like permease